MTHTIGTALDAALANNPARPLLTQLFAGGQRIELSVRTFENNVAKAANLLRDDVECGSQSRISLLLPLHWQTSVWLGASALVGSQAQIGSVASDSLACISGPDHLAELRELAPTGAALYATALHPLGLPFPAEPTGAIDVAREVRAHGDRFSAYDLVPPEAPWLQFGSASWTQGEAIESARTLADSLGLGKGGRLLCSIDLDEQSVLALLALPLAIDGSVVLVTDPGADLDIVFAQEQCDARLS